MEFIIAIIFGAIVNTLTVSTVTMEDCKERNFEPKACKVQEKLNDLGEKSKK